MHGSCSVSVTEELDFQGIAIFKKKINWEVDDRPFTSIKI